MNENIKYFFNISSFLKAEPRFNYPRIAEQKNLSWGGNSYKNKTNILRGNNPYIKHKSLWRNKKFDYKKKYKGYTRRKSFYFKKLNAIKQEAKIRGVSIAKEKEEQKLSSRR